MWSPELDIDLSDIEGNDEVIEVADIDTQPSTNCWEFILLLLMYSSFNQT